MQEGRFAGACQDKHAGRPAPSLGWPGTGERKSIDATSQGKSRFPGGHLAKRNQSVQQAKVTGLGARAPRSLGPRP